jgi:hypothetical protein
MSAVWSQVVGRAYAMVALLKLKLRAFCALRYNARALMGLVRSAWQL